ncbi:hypothetical protein BKC07_26410, partial [Peribacillus simplex]
RLLREKRVEGRPHRRKATRRLPDRPRKASTLRSNRRSMFYEPLKKLKTKRGLSKFQNRVDWNGRCETPAGKARRGETPQAQSDEEAPRPPAESE